MPKITHDPPAAGVVAAGEQQAISEGLRRSKGDATDIPPAAELPLAATAEDSKINGSENFPEINVMGGKRAYQLPLAPTTQLRGAGR